MTQSSIELPVSSDCPFHFALPSVIRLKRKQSLRSCFAYLTLTVGLLVVQVCTASAATMRTFGPFDFTFYNQGESGFGFNSQQNWTEEQIEDVAFAAGVWDAAIENV